MAQLTWRPVNAPNTSGAAATFANANQTIQQSISNLGTLATDFGNQQQTANTDAALAQISQASSTDELDALSTPEALQQYGNFDRGQVAQAVNNLRQRFAQNETQANQFNQRQDLAERQFLETQEQNDANNQFRLDQLALQRERNNVYNRSIGLQADRVETERKSAAAYDLGYKAGGDFATQSDVQAFLAKRRKEMLDAGSSAVEVNEFTRGVNERFNYAITNSPTGGSADSVSTKVTRNLDDITNSTISALDVSESIENPDNNVVSLATSLTPKITSQQDAIRILTDNFGSGSGEIVRKYISEGRKGTNPLPLNILVASALQNAGDNTGLFGLTGNEFFNTDVALSQTRRVTTGVQDGSIFDVKSLNSDDARNIGDLRAQADSANINLNNLIRAQGLAETNYGADSEQNQEALQRVEEARAVLETATDTLRKESTKIKDRVKAKSEEVIPDETPEQREQRLQDEERRQAVTDAATRARGTYYKPVWLQ